MFTRDNLWFGLRGHWWSFENQPSLFSSLGKYLGWFLIMSLWSQKPKDFGVKNWYFAGSETPQCIRLSCQSFSQIQSLHLWQIRISWDWELEIVLFRFLFHILFSPQEWEGISNIWRLGCSQLFSLNLDSFPVSPPSPFQGITEYHGHLFGWKIGPTFNSPPWNYDFTPAKWWVGRW